MLGLKPRGIPETVSWARRGDRMLAWTMGDKGHLSDVLGRESLAIVGTEGGSIIETGEAFAYDGSTGHVFTPSTDITGSEDHFVIVPFRVTDYSQSPILYGCWGGGLGFAEWFLFQIAGDGRLIFGVSTSTTRDVGLRPSGFGAAVDDGDLHVAVFKIYGVPSGTRRVIWVDGEKWLDQTCGGSMAKGYSGYGSIGGAYKSDGTFPYAMVGDIPFVYHGVVVPDDDVCAELSIDPLAIFEPEDEWWMDAAMSGQQAAQRRRMLQTMMMRRAG